MFLELSPDIKTSSLQSKYVKFLRFLDHYPEFKIYNTIVYHDHKNLFSKNELDRILGLFEEQKSIFMISSRQGWTAADELKSACKFPRYRSSEKETRQWIDEKVRKQHATWDGQVYATSFIVYKNIGSITCILDEVYKTINDLQQPQCQVIWSIIIQNHQEILQSIHWTETSMIRRTPLPFIKNARRSMRHAARAPVAKVFAWLGVDYEAFRKRYVLKVLPPSIK